MQTTNGRKLRKPAKAHRLGEPEIKALVLNRLRELRRIDRRSSLANEFCLGRTGVRADLAIRSDRLVGVEIKSDLDRLRRLPSQLAVYRTYFDCTLLVVATRHLSALPFDELIGVEVWECAADGTLRTIQGGAGDGHAAEARWADLMTQVERRRFLVGNARTGHAAFRLAFDHRFAATSREFWGSVGRRRVKAEDLARLSRFRELRVTNAALAKERSAKWAEFAERAQEILKGSAPATSEPSQAA